MGYNKSREEQKWVRWKEAEETKLRTLGVSEDVIQRLHTYDWEVFKAERNYQEKLLSKNSRSHGIDVTDLELPIKDVKSFLDSIEDENLFHLLSEENPLTVEILFLKIMGYNGLEISNQIGISHKAVNLRLVRLRKKLKKFLDR